jgi:hypothetical protein
LPSLSPSIGRHPVQIRRRPGRVPADICRHLGIAPVLCTGEFWNNVFTR